tara:strand:- start:23006 stop:23626 length:621 start_codon:yes stop_codon:yes gene_type:complete
MTKTLTFPLATRRAADPKHPVLQELETYWQSLRNEGDIPNRADIDPAAIDKALPYTFVLQRVAPGVARIRVAGQKLHDILRMDPRGMPVSAFFCADDLSTLAVHLESAFCEPALIAVPVQGAAGLLRGTVKGAMLLLPMRDDQGDISRVLGALVTDGLLGARSRRLRLDDAQPMRMEPLRPTPPGVPQMQRPDVSRPALRLVVNNS